MSKEPSTTDGSGRDQHGRFKPGNAFSQGNDRNRQVAAWRKGFDAVVGAEQFRAVIQNLLAAALGGEPWAIREVLSRCLGTPAPVDVLQEIETMRIELERIGNEFKN